MANILTGVSNANSGFNSVLQILGYNSWQLQDGSYNGCTFTAFTKYGAIENNPLFQSGVNTIASINQLTGSNLLGTDPNGLGRLYNTLLTSLQYSTETFYNIVILKPPFSNKGNLQNLGTAGKEFKLTLVFYGDNHQTALYNLENAINNPPVNNYKVLVHPIFGLIQGITEVTSFKIEDSYDRWNASLVNITFRSELSNYSQVPSLSNVQNILNAIQAILSLILAIEAELNVLSEIGNTFNQNVNNITNNLYNNTNYGYKNSSISVSNSSLDNTPVNNNIIPIISDNFNSGVANIILNNYNNLVFSTVKQLSQLNNGLFNKLINSLTISVGYLYNFYNYILNNNSSYVIYTTPYDMTLREVLIYNSIDVSLLTEKSLLNPDYNLSYIPKGSRIIL